MHPDSDCKNSDDGIK